MIDESDRQFQKGTYKVVKTKGGLTTLQSIDKSSKPVKIVDVTLLEITKLGRPTKHAAESLFSRARNPKMLVGAAVALGVGYLGMKLSEE